VNTLPLDLVIVSFMAQSPNGLRPPVLLFLTPP
jgi:hypothetical protein